MAKYEKCFQGEFDLLTGEGRTLSLCAITSGDSSWKISIWGEPSFFDQLLTNCKGVEL